MIAGCSILHEAYDEGDSGGSLQLHVRRMPKHLGSSKECLSKTRGSLPQQVPIPAR